MYYFESIAYFLDVFANKLYNSFCMFMQELQEVTALKEKNVANNYKKSITLVLWKKEIT